MHLVKWIRKNERRLMTIAAIVIMLSFAGGSALQQILTRMGGGVNRTVARFGDKKRISPKHIMNAQSELQVLKYLRADIYCRYKPMRYGAPDIRARLLGQILFPDMQSASDVNMELKQAMAQGQLKIDVAEIEKFFSQSGGNSELFWILLKAEAREAGCVVSVAKAREELKGFISQIMQGQVTAAQLVESIIKNQAVTEERIIGVFADLMSVLTYAEIVTENEDVTTSQIRAAIARNGERINAEFVKIAAADLVAEQAEPSEEELLEQFNSYKVYRQGATSEENLRGFGYKLPARVRLECLLAKIEDIEGIIDAPTEEEMEQFYQRNTNTPAYSRMFKYEVAVDPNDPEGEKISKTKTYAEVMAQIKAILVREKTDRRADMIFNEAMSALETGFEGLDLNSATSEELSAAAVDYGAAAKELSEKYGISIYTGKTGMLNAQDIASDNNLGQLSLEGRNQMPVYLGKIALAVEEASGSTLGYFDVARPRMWENIGPMKDRYGSVIGIVRVVEAAKAAEPEDLNITFSTKGAVLDEEEEAGAEEKVYSVREKVVEDCKLLKATEAAQVLIDELAGLVKEKGWDEGLSEFNKSHGEEGDKDAAAKDRFKLDNIRSRARTASSDIEQIKHFAEENPMAAQYLRNMIESKELLEKLYELLPPGQTESKDINAVLELEAEGGYCLVKDVSRTAVTNEDYNRTKGMIAFQLNAARADSLALVHFMPENIIKRTNYRPVERDEREETESEQTGAETGGES